jgi:hypothetical protein
LKARQLDDPENIVDLRVTYDSFIDREKQYTDPEDHRVQRHSRQDRTKTGYIQEEVS